MERELSSLCHRWDEIVDNKSNRSLIIISCGSTLNLIPSDSDVRCDDLFTKQTNAILSSLFIAFSLFLSFAGNMKNLIYF